MKLHFRDYGSGDPLIILHGLFGSHDNWHSISRALAERFRVLALDLRNHGQSPHSPEMNYLLMAADLDEFFRDHALERAHVLGHSMGGKTAMQFALDFPARVESLLVADMAPRAYAAVHEPIFAALEALDLHLFSTRGQIDAALAPAIPDPAVRRFLMKNLAADGAAGWRWKWNLSAIRSCYPALNAALDPAETWDGPALFICGEKSDYVRKQDRPEIQRLFPRAEILCLAGAGHWVHADAPEAFLAAAKNFLKG